LIASFAPADSQTRISAEERFFTIEWRLEQASGSHPAIVGSFANPYVYSLHRVQLQAQVLDAAGQITHETFATMNDVPAGGRGNFRLPIPATGARYTVTVHGFEFGPGESP
jgi:hypothetical protein